MKRSLFDTRIKMRHLSCFLEVVRQGGVAQAGAALNLTQPAVSKAVAELETILGVALFDRAGRRLVPTGFGKTFVRYATAAAVALRQGLDAIERNGGDRAAVRFGALPTVEDSIVPQAVARFISGPLACRVLVESGPSQHIMPLLRQGALDFTVGRMAQPDVMHGLVFEHLFSETMILATAAHHPLAAGRDLSFRDIDDFPVLMPPEGAIIRSMVDALLLADGLSFIARPVETVSNSFARSFALATDAVWIISRSVVAADLDQGDLVALDIDTRMSHGPVGITTRTGADLSVAAQALMEALRAAASDRAAAT